MHYSSRTGLAFLLVTAAAASMGCSAASDTKSSESSADAQEDALFASIPQLPSKALSCAEDRGPGFMRCHARVVTDNTGVVQTSTKPQGYGPTDLAAAYNIPTSTSTATIALVDAQDDPDAEADLATYRSQYGLPPCTTANGCFKKVDQTGGASYPAPDQGWAGEIMLDIEMASAACPTCKIVLVEASSASTADLGTAVNEAVTLGASVVSNSYGGAEDDTNSSSDASYYHHPGVAIFASAGDQGYGAEYPAAGQWVIGVGGTTLKQETNTRGWAERAWADGGSGCSAFTPKPSWQTDSACSFKIVSDLAAVADPNTGVAVYDNYGSGGWAVYGGTSVASPLVASIFAAVGLAKVDASAIWGHTTEYRDVTKGSNGTCSTALFCTAGAGYDGPTGWGTPVASKLLKLAATL